MLIAQWSVPESNGLVEFPTVSALSLLLAELTINQDFDGHSPDCPLFAMRVAFPTRRRSKL